MSGTLRSLRDWLTDQLAEVRHAAPLAVLAPAKPTPVAVPDLDDMPSTDTEPCCERGLLSGGQHECDSPAEWVIQIRHLRHAPHCTATAALVCGTCHDLIVAAADDLARKNAVCQKCSARVRCLRDTIAGEVRL